MLLELAKQYPDLIEAIEVERFRVVGVSYELKAVIRLEESLRLTLVFPQTDICLTEPRNNDSGQFPGPDFRLFFNRLS
jgi:hypothetical protein